MFADEQKNPIFLEAACLASHGSRFHLLVNVVLTRVLIVCGPRSRFNSGPVVDREEAISWLFVVELSHRRTCLGARVFSV